jgi:hypothetical protein
VLFAALLKEFQNIFNVHVACPRLSHALQEAVRDAISYPRLPTASSRTCVLEYVITQIIQSIRVLLQCQLQRLVRLVYVLCGI